AAGWERADYVRKEFLKTVTLAGAGLPTEVPPSKVVDMLEGSKEGSPFEIVAGEVLLERWAGIPARIGYGFDKGQALTDGSDEIRPRNGSSWLEVNFKELGWFPVTGAPLHAKASSGGKNVQNTDQNVLPSDDIAVNLFIPIDQVTPSLLYEQIRPVVLAVVLALAMIGLVYALWPAAYKAYRRWRRRNWALGTGRRARIAVTYAEFRELAIDLGDDHYAETPLSFLKHLVEDPEHTEFAWMVTRLLWGDLVGQATDDDVHAAEEMSRSLRRRMARAQPASVRFLAIISRLSLRHPYAVGLEKRIQKEKAA
ncbi:MAG: transglutaminase-like domain-containing protein, partial [Candidatus Dormibacteria bacterium]